MLRRSPVWKHPHTRNSFMEAIVALGLLSFDADLRPGSEGRDMMSVKALTGKPSQDQVGLRRAVTRGRNWPI